MTTEGISGAAPAPTTSPGGGRRPSALGYWLGVAILVAGLIGGGVLAVATAVGAYDRLTDLPRTSVPGELSVEVTDTGDQLVYYLGGAETSWRELGLEVTSPDGQAVVVTNYLPTVRLASTGPHDDGLHWGSGDWDEHRVVLATFDAETTGTYNVTTTGSAEDGAELAVGENLVRPVVILLVVAAGVAVAGAVGGVTLFVVTGVRRSRARVA
jgi:hypothetical protein